MNICKPFELALKKKKIDNWDKIYVLVDIHDTIFKASYYNKEMFEWFPYAKETLQVMSNRDDICLIIWTSSYTEKIQMYIHELADNGIHIDMINDNTEVNNTTLSSFDKKPYFNVGIDDKFGFEPETDWEILYNFLK